MAFVSMEDLYGSMEIIVFENAYQSAGATLMEDNVVLVEGRLSIREEDQNVTIIANKIVPLGTPLSAPLGTFPKGKSVPFGTLENMTTRKILEINITNLTEEQKEQLRGALKFFTGDKNNAPVQIINGENKMPAGGIFLNGNTLEELQEIVGKENCTIGDVS